MKVKEVITMHESPFEFDNINRTGEVLVKYNTNGINGYKFYKNTQGGLLVFYLVDDNQIIAAVVGLPNNDYIQVKRVYVLDKYKGNNLAVKMYHGIIYSEFKNLMSDTEQTASGKKVWQDIAKITPVKSLNLSTGDFGDIADAYQETPDIVLVTDSPNLVESLLIPNLKILEN